MNKSQLEQELQEAKEYIDVLQNKHLEYYKESCEKLIKEKEKYNQLLSFTISVIAVLKPKPEHYSELLQVLKIASHELWLNHDTENPPTKAMLEAWLNQYSIKLSGNEVTAIDKVLRPDGKKGGKNKPK